MVAGPGEGRTLVGDAQQRRAQLAARRVEEGRVEEPGGALGRRAGLVALAQRQQVADRRTDDGVVERAAARDVGDTQLDAADVERLGRGPRLRERGLGPQTLGLGGRAGVLADDVVGHGAEV